ncbi:MAG: HEAT repeat domain-containing protein [Actinomycetota bacterium]|nr:HEAT repeat domain-containing protein [Actinomycetota bacterium]
MSCEEDSLEFTHSGIERRQQLVQLAREGDLSLARELCGDGDPRVRASSVAVLSENDALDESLIALGLSDPHPLVRMAVARAAAQNSSISVLELLSDEDSSVVEIACWAAGEQTEHNDSLIEALSAIALEHKDALCRESAVAALGALGDVRGLESILKATQDIATVRRRAVIALAPFEGQAVTDALQLALSDRDWQVRQAAEDLTIYLSE